MARIPVTRKLVFALAVTSMVLTLAELGARSLFSADLHAWAAPLPETQNGPPNMPGNPYLLWEMAPGAHQEMGVLVHVNSLGLRGPEVRIPKPKGIRRFMTVGDSSVFGFGVKDDEVWSAVAARELGPKVEAVNAAIPGYSTWQSINLLRMRAMKTDPDLIVIGDLWSDNNFDAFVDKELLSTYAGYDESLTGHIQRILSKSALFRVLDWRLRVRTRAAKVRKVGWMLGKGQPTGRRRVAIQDYAQNLQTLVDMARNHGAEVVFLLPANNEDVEGPDTGTRSMNGMKAWTPYRQVMRDAAKRNGAPLIDVPKLFQESGLSREELFLDAMHPTAVGQRIMGEGLAKLLREHDWPDGGSVMSKGTGGPIPHYTDPFVQTQPNASTLASPSPSENGQPSEGGDAQVARLSPNRLEGEVVCDSCAKYFIQIEAITPGVEGMPTVLATTLLQQPGPFTLQLSQPGKVKLRAYLDSDAKGPGPDDKRFELQDAVFDVEGKPVTGLVVDLDASRVRHEG